MANVSDLNSASISATDLEPLGARAAGAEEELPLSAVAELREEGLVPVAGSLPLATGAAVTGGSAPEEAAAAALRS